MMASWTPRRQAEGHQSENQLLLHLQQSRSKSVYSDGFRNGIYSIHSTGALNKIYAPTGCGSRYEPSRFYIYTINL